MATKTKPDPRKLLVKINRHLTGQIRRAPGQRFWLTPTQVEKQGLFAGDFVVVKQICGGDRYTPRKRPVPTAEATDQTPETNPESGGGEAADAS